MASEGSFRVLISDSLSPKGVELLQSTPDIEVTVNDDMLTVKGEKKIERQVEKKGYYLSERSYGATSVAWCGC